MADSVGMVSGFIRDAASGKALREAEITLSARLPGTRHAPGKLVEIWAMSDWAGYYAACGVPQRQVVTVQVRLPGWSGVATSTQLSAGDVVQLNFELTELAAKPQPN